MRHKKKVIYLGVLVFVLIFGLGIVYAVERIGDNGAASVIVTDKPERDAKNESAADSEESVFCTMDAKQCPDGSYVGRQAPDCEFAPCPSEK